MTLLPKIALKPTLEPDFETAYPLPEVVPSAWTGRRRE